MVDDVSGDETFDDDRADAAPTPRRRMRLGIDGETAVEFALLAPVFFAVLFGSICYGCLFGINHSVQELSSAAARAAVAGLSDAERSALVTDYVARNGPSYVLLDPTRLQVSVATFDAATRSFRVAVDYDASGSFVYVFRGLVPLPPPTITRTAVMQRGGY
jgi:Flp pilus assembly protein TadG